MNLIEELEKLIESWSGEQFNPDAWYDTSDKEREILEGIEEAKNDCAEELKDLLEKYKNEKISG